VLIREALLDEQRLLRATSSPAFVYQLQRHDRIRWSICCYDARVHRISFMVSGVERRRLVRHVREGDAGVGGDGIEMTWLEYELIIVCRTKCR
jgi:hypothetical protein